MGVWELTGRNKYKLNHFAWFSNDTTNDELTVIKEGASIVSYTGGKLCSIDLPLECPTSEGESWFTSEYFNPFTIDENEVQSGSLVLTSTYTTPEPTSIALLATGLICALGVFRKKLLVRFAN